MDPKEIARFLILDGQFPRSLVFCYEKIRSNMAGLAKEYGHEVSAHELLRDAGARLHQISIDEIFEGGLHELDRKSTRVNSSHKCACRMPSSARKKNNITTFPIYHIATSNLVTPITIAQPTIV